MDKRHLLFVSLLLTFIPASLVAALDQSGFIMIDCGASDNYNYTDPITGIFYVSDTKYIDTGVNYTIDSAYYSKYTDQFVHLRAFPEGVRNCYTIIPPYVKNKSRYFIRARFAYGNYDGKGKGPVFDLYLGVNLWATVDMSDSYHGFSSYVRTLEILHTPSSNYTYVCLVNTGHGTPFVSVIELRLVDDNIYNAITTSGSMQLVQRADVGLSDYSTAYGKRYKDDPYDRLWDDTHSISSYTSVSTTFPITQNSYKLPYTAMSTADTSKYPDVLSFSYYPSDANTSIYHMFFHFADFQSSAYTREFGIYYENQALQLNVIPSYLSDTTVYNLLPRILPMVVNVSFVSTARSILPPILNAYEIYSTMELPNKFTDTGDVYAIRNIKATYRVKRNCQGDPCTPITQQWEGVDCFNATSVDAPRIVSLTLSFGGLTGVISPSIGNLTMLEHLDLSFNDLTGELPNFLTQMPKLNVLILSGNKFTGTIPPKLLERSKSGTLLLSVDLNPKDALGIGAIMAIIFGIAFFILLIAFGVIWKKLHQQKHQQQVQPPQQHPQPQEDPPQHPQPRGEPAAVPIEPVNTETAVLKSKDLHYSYSDVKKITENFQTELGGGGSGKVYLGFLNKKQVAVKMLSPSSVQGYRQFKAEAMLLMTVRHNNLTTLVGFCDEGDNLGLIYEFMANGDLRSHLSESNPDYILSWETRIDIALNAAQGLEYLHYGCTPPIIHRNVKSTNILLDDKFHAKLGDFGLSKVFSVEGSTSVSSAFTGTPGYLDPEFNTNDKSDVFSFGVVLLELITGKPARSQTGVHLTDWIREIIAKGDIRNVVDPRLGRDFDVNSMWKVVDLAIECVSATSSLRPIMNIVVMKLTSCLVMEKTRIMSNIRSNGSNYDSGEISTLNIETTRLPPYAR